MKTPDLFLIGAPKAGTSALADVLAGHPDVFAAKKEPRYFDAAVFHDDPLKHAFRSLADYLGLYRSRAAQAAHYRLDASTFIMYDPSAVLRIREISPDARFLVVLRDPVEASRSMHAQRMKYADPALRELSEDFCTCWQLLEERRNGTGFPEGCRNRILFRYDHLYHYERHIPPILEAIGSNPILMIDFQDLRESPEETVQMVAGFLDLDTDQFPDMRTVNASHHRSAAQGDRLRSGIIKTLARITRTGRQRLGLIGYRATTLKRVAVALIRKSTKPIPVAKLNCTDAVVAEFAETRIFLDKLFADQKQNKGP